MTTSIPQRYTVRRIPGGEGKAYIRERHYSKSCHNGPMTWGLFDGDDLIGVCAFATPCSEAVRSSLFGPEFKDSVTELHRLHIMDCTPKNTESWFITQALKGLAEERPRIRAVISFADSTEGHSGTIYQACNAIYAGTTWSARFWRDRDGRLRHRRQNGHNVTPDEASALGWTPERRGAKHRYVLLLGAPNERRWARKHLLLDSFPYPRN